MSLPSAADVVNKFLYGQNETPVNLNTSSLTDSTGERAILVDTAAYFDQDTGPGRFALASNSALVEAFFSLDPDHLIDLIEYHIDATVWTEDWKAPDGSYRLSKEDLAAVLGIDSYGINVANRSVADGYDDYAERTFIWGGTRAKLSDDVIFVIDSSETRYIENMAIVPNGDDDFDWNGSDFITQAGESTLRHAIDPSGIGVRVELQFEDYEPETYTYTAGSYLLDLAKESSWTEPSLNDLFAAMQEVTDDLWSAGVTKFVVDDRPVIYGTSDDDTILETTTTDHFDIAVPYHTASNLWSMELHLDDYVGNGVLYRAGAGNDNILATDANDVIYGDDGSDQLLGRDGLDVVIGGDGADGLYGGGQGNRV